MFNLITIFLHHVRWVGLALSKSNSEMRGHVWPAFLRERTTDRSNFSSVRGIPFEFILFGSTLVGVAVFHHHTLRVSFIGLTAIICYKVLFTGFKAGPGLLGLLFHLEHEWVLLANLFALLTGFALLSHHFEESGVPEVLPRILPHDWKRGFLLLAIVWVLSSFLDNIADALIGGPWRTSSSAAKCTSVSSRPSSASNAGGAWSVIGDTTTTMLWIASVPPSQVFGAIIAAAVALFLFGIPAAFQQQRYSPIRQRIVTHAKIDWMRVAIVGLILVLALAVNVTANTRFALYAESFPFLGAAVWLAFFSQHRYAGRIRGCSPALHAVHSSFSPSSCARP
jgi:Na+/H+ antiporter NhaD/arsenite permease-like protein